MINTMTNMMKNPEDCKACAGEDVPHACGINNSTGEGTIKPKNSDDKEPGLDEEEDFDEDEDEDDEDDDDEDYDWLFLVPA